MLPWLLLIGGGICLALLYDRRQRIGAAGYCILTVMLLPWLAINLWGLISCRRQERLLDVDCLACSQPLAVRDLPALQQTGLCPKCGQAISREVLEDVW